MHLTKLPAKWRSFCFCFRLDALMRMNGGSYGICTSVRIQVSHNITLLVVIWLFAYENENALRWLSHATACVTPDTLCMPCTLHAVYLLNPTTTDITPWVCYERRFNEFYISIIWKPISFQSKASVVCSATTAISLDFCMEKLNVLSRQIDKN